MSKAKYDRLEADVKFTASGTNAISGTTTISGTVTDSSTKTVSGSQTFSGDNTFTGNQTLSGAGTARPIGWNRMSSRYELQWVGGQHGKPALNAVIATDETSNAAAHLARNLADRQFEVLGLNATTATVAINVEGGVTLTTTTGANDQVIIVPHLDTNQSAWSVVTWGTDKSTEWECDISTSSNITDNVIWAGLKLTNTSVTATDNDQVFFRYAAATNSGKWQAIYSIGGTDTAGDAGVTVAVSTRYHLKILISAARIATMYINGVLVATSTALTDATDLIPYIGVETTTTAAKSIVAHGQAISRVIG